MLWHFAERVRFFPIKPQKRFDKGRVFEVVIKI